MKNETNTQHTPELNLSWEEAENGILVFYPHLSGGRPELIHKDAIETHRQRCDEQTSGHVSAKYVPYLDAIKAPELLKENEQLKEQLETGANQYAKAVADLEQLQAINAELLEELKAAKTRLAFLNSDEAKHYSNDNYFWVNSAEKLK